MEMLQAQIDVTNHKLWEMLRMFKTLMNRGLPIFWEERGPLLSQKDYQDFMFDCQSDHQKFEDMEQVLSGKVVFDKLVSDFELWFDFKTTRPKVPMTSYSEAMEFQAQAYDMVTAPLPGPGTWKTICHYGVVQLAPP